MPILSHPFSGPSHDVVEPFDCFSNAVLDARSLGLAVRALFCALEIIPLARLSMEVAAATTKVATLTTKPVLRKSSCVRKPTELESPQVLTASPELVFTTGRN